MTLEELMKRPVPPRLQLILHATPIEQHDKILALQGIDPGKWSLFIKRDDLTELVGSGNKIRKLEFSLGSYKQDKITDIISAGAINSNHCRAVAFVGAKLGLQAHLVLRDYQPGAVLWGNTLVNQMMGARMYLSQPDRNKHMEELKSQLEKQGKKALVIPVGASNHIGCWGYINCYREIINQNIGQFTDLVATFGSGGTIAGLAIANYLNGSPVKLHCACVVDDTEKEMKDFIQDLIDSFKLAGSPKVDDLINFFPSAAGLGYTKSQDEELHFIHEIAKSTSLVFDRTYTGKSFYQLVKQLKSKPQQFKGTKILFVMTGGLFTMFDEVTQNYVSKH